MKRASRGKAPARRDDDGRALGSTCRKPPNRPPSSSAFGATPSLGCWPAWVVFEPKGLFDPRQMECNRAGACGSSEMLLVQRLGLRDLRQGLALIAQHGGDLRQGEQHLRFGFVSPADVLEHRLHATCHPVELLLHEVRAAVAMVQDRSSQSVKRLRRQFGTAAVYAAIAR